MKPALDDGALDQLFREARTRNGWTDTPVSEAQIRAIYELMKFGPTTGNSCPARFTWLLTREARLRLEPYCDQGNKAKMVASPVTVIIAYDVDFHEQMPKLFPHDPSAVGWWPDPVARERVALRNGSLQGAYLMLAARSLGLDCGPMSGFDNAGVDREFFAGTSWRSNFICSIGEGTDEKLFPRSPRLAFEEACQVL